MDDVVLRTSSPEAQGVDVSALGALLDELDSALDSLHGFVLVRHERLVAEAAWAPYTTTRPHTLYSVSKSFTSAAVGLAVSEGLLSVDDRIVQHFPEQAPPNVDARLLDLRVHHLLTMTTGHTEDSTDALLRTGTGDWVRTFLAQPLNTDPGTTFLYDTGASFVLSALVQKVTGQRLLDYLRPRLLDPLGITDATWEQNPQGIDLGGFGLSISTRDIAAFGLMLLQGGTFRGGQVLPPEWVAMATSPLVPSVGESIDWDLGYGYQFWMSTFGFRADGMFGQFCIVLPGDDAVIAITASVQNMQKPLDIIWRHREALFGGTPSGADDEGEPAVFAFEVPSPKPHPEMPFAAIDLVHYRLDAPGWRNVPDTLALHSTPDGATMLLGFDGVESKIVYGVNEWVPSTIPFAGRSDVPVFARGAWVHEEEFRGRVLSAEGPHGIDHTIRFFPDDTLEWTSRELVGFGPVIEHRATGVPYRPAVVQEPPQSGRIAAP